MKITFIALQDHHLPVLLAWLEAPHVKAWWDPDVLWTPELIKEKYGSYVHGYKLEEGIKKPMRAYIIAIDGHEIGYIQLYNAYDYRREGDCDLEGLPNSLAAFDIFIGDAGSVGKGYGAKIMQQFLHEYVDPFYAACFVDPDAANVQAIRAYAKAGFVSLKTVQEGTVVWMVRMRRNDA